MPPYFCAICTLEVYSYTMNILAYLNHFNYFNYFVLQMHFYKLRERPQTGMVALSFEDGV